MTIEINSKNEYTVFPDVQDNLKKPEKERFAVVLHRIGRYKMNNAALRRDGVGEDGKPKFHYDSVDFLRASIKRLVNAPMLQDEGGDLHEMTVEDLLAVPELDGIAIQVEDKAWKLHNEGDLEIKNS